MDDQECPRCKTTRYRNPSLKLMVNVCGHALCENCVELLFVRGSGACPQCNVPLRRTNFRVQLFEDPTVEKEVDIRRKILKDFNKKEEDFSSLNEYNDYLEMIETIIFNLSNGIDVEQTNKRVEKYRKENQDQIKKNRNKLSKEEEYLDDLIEMEREITEQVRQEVLQEQLQEKKDKQRNRQELLDKLMYSEGSADQILASHKRELLEQARREAESAQNIPRRRTEFSSGISYGKNNQNVFVPVPKADVGELYEHEPVIITYCGPEPVEYDELDQSGYLKHIREASERDLGGGYATELGCYRALQDAFSGLYFTYDIVRKITSPGMDVS